MRKKFIVVTGGVLSGLGKGIVSASIMRLLSPYYKVVPVKCDGYLNVDPGTMNPIEHGEVFVLDDGGEVDLDFGHYERFMNKNCKKTWNLTSGKVFQRLMEKERRGDFLGKTVQVIPHVTGEIRNQFKEIIRQEKADILLVEVGGTVGDLENLWFLEALRELQREIPREDIIFIHLGLVPVIDAQGQQKTKPLQQSILFLRERGIVPDVLIGRSQKPLTKKTKKKLEYICNIKPGHIISDPDLENVYELPLIFQKEGLLDVLKKDLKMKIKSDMRSWKKLVHNMKNPKRQVNIAICGKYTELADSYLSVMEALTHAGAHLGCKINLRWIETTDIEDGKVDVSTVMTGMQGVIVPGGFGTRGTEGKIKIIEWVRKSNIPFLGICLGMQLAVIEYARNVCGLADAHSTEMAKTANPVIDYLPEQLSVTQKGGTMRLGGHDVMLKKGSYATKLFKKKKIRRRFRHRYEVNPEYIPVLEKEGLVFSGKAANQPIMQFMELPKHKYFVAGQFHPELTSRLERPSEMFIGLVRNAMKQ